MTSTPKGEGRQTVDNRIVLADSIDVLRDMPSQSVPLVYIDPPFNTGKRKSHQRMTVVRDDQNGDRTGFQERRYRTILDERKSSYEDEFEDYLGFLRRRLVELHRVLTPAGSLFFHIDYRESHYCKVMLDEIFGRTQFINEIIWSYDFGGRSKARWPAKHDVIFWFAKDSTNYTFRYDDIDRIPYLAPSLVGKEKAERGKTPTDVWWQTIVPTNGRERTGYPTQKPLAILERIVRVHSNPGEMVLDCFAGSGTTGDAAARNGRRFLLVDSNPEAVEVMARRLAYSDPILEGFEVQETTLDGKQGVLV